MGHIRAYLLSVRMKKLANFFWQLDVLLLGAVNLFVASMGLNHGLFDSALFGLQLHYPLVGLQPFRDFIIYYPDGLSIVSGLVHKFTFGALSFESLIWPLHFLLQLFFLKRVASFCEAGNAALNFVLLVLVVETCFYFLLGTEPFSLLIASILLLDLYKAVQKKHEISAEFLVLAFVLCFLRWDRLIYCYIATLGFYIYSFLIKQQFKLMPFLKISITFLKVFLLFIFSLAILHPADFLVVIKSIFFDPFEIAKNRSLHYSIRTDLLGVQTAKYALMGFYIYIGYQIVIAKKYVDDVFFYFFGLSPLPYGLSRPDMAHLFPFFFTTSIYCAVCFLRKYSLKFELSRLVLCIFGLLFIVVTILFSIPQKNTEKMVENCVGLVKAKEIKPKTIFVGNASYEDVVINFPLFYLKNLDLPPATKYISDEPGIQNSCEVQKEMILEMNEAEKPIIFYLNASKIIDKNNLNKASSCNILEKFHENRLKKVGECVVGKYQVEVKVLY